jgi:hypothetical protein
MGMRKIICLATLIFCLLLSAQLKAQNFRFGLKASPLLTWMKSEDKSIEHRGLKAGFNYGLMFEYLLTENYGAASGITITHKGGKVAYTDSVPFPITIKENSEKTRIDTFRQPKVNLNTQYLEIPITLKLKTNEIGYMTYFGQFGIAPGINLRSKADIEAKNRDAIDVNLIKDMRTFNIALQMGAGFEYNLGGNTSLLIGLYFNNGFADVNRFGNNRVILNHLALRAGVLF